jgi:hypothetical protein|tara:strand:+ start:109332 stop:109763 length:432 start_codon:yes stop_codon:yes gene_type:complete
MTTTTKPNTAFWIIAVLALLWNVMGVIQFVVSTFMLEMVTEGVSSEEMDLYTGMPAWYTVAFGIATIAGLLACITMLMRKKITIGLFGLSLIAVLIAQGYWIFATDVMDIIGPTAIIMPLVVIAICIFLYFYSKGAKQRGWLN